MNGGLGSPVSEKSWAERLARLNAGQIPVGMRAIRAVVPGGWRHSGRRWPAP